MSQYGYIPASRIADLQQNYSIASPASWQFDKNGQLYGGMEEVLFSPAQKTEIVNLGGAWFENADSFSNWMSGNALLDLVKKRIAKGLDVKLRYLSENAGVSISPSDNIAQLTAFQSVIMLLDVGDLQTALGAISSVPEASFVLTPGYNTKAERKQTYIDELTAAVADLFE